MGLDVGPKAQTMLFRIRRHPIEVPIEDVEIDERHGGFEFAKAHKGPGLDGR